MSQTNPFTNALAQLATAAKYLPKSADLLKTLEQPERVITVSLPIKMDSGELKIFEGFRVQYNSARGPYKGGIRYHPQVSMDEVKALSFWMTVKNAVADLRLGGGKGGIIVDPKSLSEKELERLTRAFGRAIAPSVGPYTDIPAPDVNTNGQIMKWLSQEFSSCLSSRKIKYTKGEQLATYTGKPLDFGGSQGREQATGQGGVYALLSALKILNTEYRIPHTRPTIAVQGFGNVGYFVAKLLSDQGFLVVAVSDSKGAIYNPKGLDVEKELAFKKKTGRLDARTNNSITNNSLLELPVDILVPSALENQITQENAGNIQAKIILEMANGPTTPEADRILHQKGTVVIPDVLANSGGVTVSYFEWQQNISGQKWSLKKVNEKLKSNIEKSTRDVIAAAQKNKVDLRTGAFILALSRIQKAKNNA
ncbi:Glu/Leu/Phe/Val dehydrogenase [Candidatus Gottesmanbacteria bacterium]|nr:Glu/Leu/Phe/Val dehydrogenase [Candidatus Gottesmanbacteria bacterium]